MKTTQKSQKRKRPKTPNSESYRQESSGEYVWDCKKAALRPAPAHCREEILIFVKVIEEVVVPDFFAVVEGSYQGTYKRWFIGGELDFHWATRQALSALHVKAAWLDTLHEGVSIYQTLGVSLSFSLTGTSWRRQKSTIITFTDSEVVLYAFRTTPSAGDGATAIILSRGARGSMGMSFVVGEVLLQEAVKVAAKIDVLPTDGPLERDDALRCDFFNLEFWNNDQDGDVQGTDNVYFVCARFRRREFS